MKERNLHLLFENSLLELSLAPFCDEISKFGGNKPDQIEILLSER